MGMWWGARIGSSDHVCAPTRNPFRAGAAQFTGYLTTVIRFAAGGVIGLVAEELAVR